MCGRILCVQCCCACKKRDEKDVPIEMYGGTSKDISGMTKASGRDSLEQNNKKWRDLACFLDRFCVLVFIALEGYLCLFVLPWPH